MSLLLVASASANELDDAYKQLKDAQTAKNPDGVLKWAVETAKLAKAEASGPKLDGFSDADWPKRVDYAKGVGTLSEYALATEAAEPGLAPAKAVELMDALLAVNPKSTYIGVGAGAYLAALSKMGGVDKQIEGAMKIIKESPNEEEALMVLADNLMCQEPCGPSLHLRYAVGDGDEVQSQARGLFRRGLESREVHVSFPRLLHAGVAGCIRQIWKECDTNLRAALPMIGHEPAMSGPAYFYLGVANYQLSKITRTAPSSRKL